MADAPASQTLSRGIRILEILAEARTPLTIDEVADRLGVHRSIAYRLVRTLEHHAVVNRGEAGRVALGAGLTALASGIAHDLQTAALPEVTAVTGDLGMTCFLAVAERDECITLMSVEPRHDVAALAQRPGARHPLTRGAPGRALLTQLPAPTDPTLAAEVARSRERGYATSHDEVIPSVRSVAAPLALRAHPPATIAVVYVGTGHDEAAIAARLIAAAAAIRAALGG